MEKEEFEERKKLEKEVGKLDRDVDSIIVEGSSDKNIMQKLGFTGKIFLSAERKIEDLVEDVSRGSEKVAVLTDFDNHGKEQNRKISHELEKEIDVIRTSRQEFGAQLTSTGRQCIEDVRPLLRSKHQKFIDAALDRLYFIG